MHTVINIWTLSIVIIVISLLFIMHNHMEHTKNTGPTRQLLLSSDGRTGTFWASFKTQQFQPEDFNPHTKTQTPISVMFENSLSEFPRIHSHITVVLNPQCASKSSIQRLQFQSTPNVTTVLHRVLAHLWVFLCDDFIIRFLSMLLGGQPLTNWRNAEVLHVEQWQYALMLQYKKSEKYTP